MYQLNNEKLAFYFSPPVIEEPKEPVDPAVRAKENWLRLYNKVLEQLREVRSQVYPKSGLKCQPSCRLDSAPPCNLKDIPEFKRLKVSTTSLKYVCVLQYLCEKTGYKQQLLEFYFNGAFCSTPEIRLNVSYFYDCFLLIFFLKIKTQLA